MVRSGVTVSHLLRIWLKFFFISLQWPPWLNSIWKTEKCYPNMIHEHRETYCCVAYLCRAGAGRRWWRLLGSLWRSQLLLCTVGIYKLMGLLQFASEPHTLTTMVLKHKSISSSIVHLWLGYFKQRRGGVSFLIWETFLYNIFFSFVLLEICRDWLL